MSQFLLNFFLIEHNFNANKFSDVQEILYQSIERMTKTRTRIFGVKQIFLVNEPLGIYAYQKPKGCPNT